jgi:hypothetical protein
MTFEAIWPAKERDLRTLTSDGTESSLISVCKQVSRKPKASRFSEYYVGSSSYLARANGFSIISVHKAFRALNTKFRWALEGVPLPQPSKRKSRAFVPWGSICSPVQTSGAG